jgi:elongation factor Ts
VVPTVSAKDIQALRDMTGAGIMDCKKALEDANGDFEKARDILHAKGMVTAAKKASRTARDGTVVAYIHSGGRIGAMVELNCETDFVARTEGFQQLAHNIALQVAAMNPKYLAADEVPSGEKVNPEEACLLQQPFIKDPSRTIQDIITAEIAKTGENMKVRRFARFALGE